MAFNELYFRKLDSGFSESFNWYKYDAKTDSKAVVTASGYFPSTSIGGNTIKASSVIYTTTADSTPQLLYVTGVSPVTVADLVDATVDLADGSVTAAKIAAGAVVAAGLGAGAVTAPAIGAGAVVTAGILDANVTGAKIAAATIASGNMAANSIVTAAITDANVTKAKLAADSVDGTKIEDDALDSEHYVDGSIDTAHLADSSVTAAKIASSAINAGKITNTGDGNATGGLMPVHRKTLPGSTSGSTDYDITVAHKVEVIGYKMRLDAAGVASTQVVIKNGSDVIGTVDTTGIINKVYTEGDGGIDGTYATINAGGTLRFTQVDGGGSNCPAVKCEAICVRTA